MELQDGSDTRIRSPVTAILEEETPMEARTWKGGTLGIRVGIHNASRYFEETWDAAIVRINGRDHTFSLRPTFWATCPELRGGAIAEWLKHQVLDHRPKGKSHRVELKPLDDCRFELTR